MRAVTQCVLKVQFLGLALDSNWHSDVFYWTKSVLYVCGREKREMGGKKFHKAPLCVPAGGCARVNEVTASSYGFQLQKSVFNA